MIDFGKTLLAAALAIVCTFSTVQTGSAGELSKPTGDVILTVTGETTIKNTESGADFDLAMIEALPKITVKTSSPWTEGVAEFEAVRLIDLLAAAGASGTTIKAAALNDYAVDLPMTDATDAGAFVAYKLNGEYMSVRDKGPLWILYPFDERPELKAEAVYSRSVWQLRKLTLSK